MLRLVDAFLHDDGVLDRDRQQVGAAVPHGVNQQGRERPAERRAPDQAPLALSHDAVLSSVVLEIEAAADDVVRQAAHQTHARFVQRQDVLVAPDV